MVIKNMCSPHFPYCSLCFGPQVFRPHRAWAHVNYHFISIAGSLETCFILFSPLESVLILESQGSDHVDPWVLHNTMMIHTIYNIISIPVIGSQENKFSNIFPSDMLNFGLIGHRLHKHYRLHLY